MTPYYEHAGITIYHGDCRDVMPTLPQVDLVLTDAPYGIHDEAVQTSHTRGGKRQGGNNTWHPASEWDMRIDPEWCALACNAAPVVAWFGHWRKRAEIEAAMSYPIRAEIIWAKDTHAGPPCPVSMRDERLWLFSREGIKGRTFETSVWFEPVIPTWAYKHHKNEKPFALMARALKFLSDPGALILDPFLGSGTTLVAARRLGRRAIGIEINDAYCEIAARRVSDAALSLFEMPMIQTQLDL